MNPTNDLLNELPTLLGLLMALISGWLLAKSWARRQRTSALETVRPASRPDVTGIVYREAPTVRVADSQRIDRVRKLVRLSVGESNDILDSRGSPMPRFRITLKEIVSAGVETPTARIQVEYGGTTLSCGPLVKETGHNEFTLPRAARDEHRSSVLHFHERRDGLDFMRIKLRAVDPTTNSADIDVKQVCGHWPAG